MLGRLVLNVVEVWVRHYVPVIPPPAAGIVPQSTMKANREEAFSSVPV